MAHKGVLLVAVGLRYKGYCSNVGRSFIVDPSEVILCSRVLSRQTLTLSLGTRVDLQFATYAPEELVVETERRYNCTGSIPGSLVICQGK